MDTHTHIHMRAHTHTLLMIWNWGCDELGLRKPWGVRSHLDDWHSRGSAKPNRLDNSTTKTPFVMETWYSLINRTRINSSTYQKQVRDPGIPQSYPDEWLEHAGASLDQAKPNVTMCIGIVHGIANTHARKKDCISNHQANVCISVSNICSKTSKQTKSPLWFLMMSIDACMQHLSRGNLGFDNHNVCFRTSQTFRYRLLIYGHVTVSI